MSDINFSTAQNRRRLIEYFIKDLSPDEQRGITGFLRDEFSSSYARNFAKHQCEGYLPCLNGIFETALEIENFLKPYHNRFLYLNNRMMKNGRAPLFENPNALNECFEYVDLLLTFDCESRWNKMLGCESFESYEPNKCKNGLTCAFDLYVNDGWLNKTLLYALTVISAPKNCIESAICSNVYEYVDFILLKNGICPLFENCEDLCSCEKRREELLTLKTKSQALDYLKCESEDLLPPKTKPICLTLHYYVLNTYGETAYKTTYSYEIGWRVKYISLPSTSPKKICEYATQANAFCSTKIFENPNDYESCIAFAKELLKLTELKKISQP